MDALDMICTRRSIRSYTDQKVSEDIIQNILKAWMSAPSAHNQHPWHFLVIQDKEILKKISETFTYGKMLEKSPLAILLCCDTTQLRSAEFWPQDMSASTENILLASHAQWLGAVWVWLYPDEDYVSFIQDYLQLPEWIIPFSLVSIWYPNEKIAEKNRFIESRIHLEKW